MIKADKTKELQGKRGAVRRMRATRAFDYEWELIDDFAKMVKENPHKAQQVLNYGKTLFKRFRKKAEKIE